MSLNHPWQRLTFVTVSAIVAATWVTWITLGTVLADRAPDTALAIGRRSPAVLANKTIALLSQPQDARTVAFGTRLAERALLAEPSNPRAALAAAMAMEASGRQADGDALMRYSEGLSRRELLVQLVLIESRVAAGDVPGTLRHYDRALSTSPQAFPVLMPVLAAAAAQPAVAGPLSRMLSRRPLWWRQFVEQLNRTGGSTPQMRSILTALRLDVRTPVERRLLSDALTRMVEIGGYVDAAGLYAAMAQDRTGSTPMFDEPNAVPPFDWQIIDGTDVGGYLESAPSGRIALKLRARDGATGIVARRLALLPTGGYSLLVRYGAVSDSLARPSVSLRCTSSPNPLRTFTLPVAPVTGATARFTGDIPAGCAAQWVEIGAGSATNLTEASWVDYLRLEPR